MQNFWCEISINKLLSNVNLIKKNTNKQIIAVVKANAYGLGIEKISELLEDRVDCFAVSTIEEAKKIKSHKDILILTPLYDAIICENCNNFIFTIDNEEILSKLDKKTQIKVHICVNTGMNRFGISPKKLPNFISLIKNYYPNIIVDGIYTHLHNSRNIKYTLNQIEIFKQAVYPFINDVNNIHCLNSSSFINPIYREKTDFTNCIRIGNLLYGYIGQQLGYKKIFHYYAKIIREYLVHKGELIGYNNKLKLKKDTRVGVLEVGYIHHFGFNKYRKNPFIYDMLKTTYHHIIPCSNIWYNGKKVKMLGNPCMNNVLIKMNDDMDLNSIVTIKLSPILGDSSILKKYVY